MHSLCQSLRLPKALNDLGHTCILQTDIALLHMFVHHPRFCLKQKMNLLEGLHQMTRFLFLLPFRQPAC